MPGFLAPRPYLGVILLLLVTCATYWSGLRGPFVFDDYNNIVNNAAIRLENPSILTLLQASLSGDAGPLKRPLSVASFAMNRAATGLDPFWFKFTNLVIHLFNGFLVFTLCRALLRVNRESGSATGGASIALFVSAVWLLHPVQLTSVLYVVQRMTSLSATFVFLGLLVYVSARQSEDPGRRLALLWIGVPLCTAFAALSKESGILLIAYAFVIESTMFRSEEVRGWTQGTPAQFFVVFLGVPALAVAGFLLTHPDWLADAADARGFDAAERMLTEARVLILYLWLLVLPIISNLALFYDDFVVSHSLWDPPTTLPAVIAVCVALAAAWRVRARHSFFSLAVLWFLAGHAMESSFVMLELVHPHRNYVAYLGPMLGLTLLGHALLRRVRTNLAYTVGTSILCALAGTTALRAHQWSDPVSLAAYEVVHRPNSARANYEFARLLHLAAGGDDKAELIARANEHLSRAARLAPTDVGALIGQVLIAEGPATANVMRELTRRLALFPLPPNQVGRLDLLVRCQRGGACKTPPEQMQSIFAAGLSHPRLLPGVKADLLTVLATYYAEQMSDVPAALRVLLEAAALVPNDPARHLNVAQLLILVPDFAGAEAQLRLAEQEDPIGSTKWRRDLIRAQIEKLQRRTVEARFEGAGPDTQPNLLHATAAARLSLPPSLSGSP
jgi:hypothetical protein